MELIFLDSFLVPVAPLRTGQIECVQLMIKAKADPHMKFLGANRHWKICPLSLGLKPG